LTVLSHTPQHKVDFFRRCTGSCIITRPLSALRDTACRLTLLRRIPTERPGSRLSKQPPTYPPKLHIAGSAFSRSRWGTSNREMVRDVSAMHPKADGGDKNMRRDRQPKASRNEQAVVLWCVSKVSSPLERVPIKATRRHTPFEYDYTTRKAILDLLYLSGNSNRAID
jgi:hypothetical protein